MPPRKKPSKKLSLKTGATIVAVVTFIGIVLALFDDAANLWDRFVGRPVPTKTASQVTTALDDIVLATFPYFIGNTWEYSFGTRTNASPDHPEANETGKYTAKVVNVETIEGKARVFYIEVSPPASNYAGFVFNAPCGSATDTKITYMVLTDGKWFYEDCDPLKIADTARNLIAKPENPPIDAVYKLPLEAGDHWGYSLQFPAPDDTFFQWYVDPKTDITVPAGTFKDCYKISFRTNPDITTHIVCPGIGLVASEYHHFGSIVDYRAELTSYSFVTQPK
jgi:hypothetical protein